MKLIPWQEALCFPLFLCVRQSFSLSGGRTSKERRQRVLSLAERNKNFVADFLLLLLPSTVSGLLEAAEEVLVTLSARIGAARALPPPLANAEPDERVTRREGLSAQFMAARGGTMEKKERKKSKVEEG